MIDALEELHAEYIDWYRGLVSQHGRIPRSASGIDSAGRQFIFFLEGLPLNSRKHLPFLCAVLAEEGCEYYVYASLLASFEEDGESKEELQIVTASKLNSVQSTFPVKRADEHTVELLDARRTQTTSPEKHLMHAFLAKPWKMDESERQKYLDLWKEIREKAQWRQRDLPLKQLLERDFEVELPISGGFGGSKEDAIILHKVVPNDYVSVEYTILKCLGIGRNIEWKLLKQTLMKHNGRKLDQMKIETRGKTETEVDSQIENYYFDVTECMDSA